MDPLQRAIVLMRRLPCAAAVLDANLRCVGVNEHMLELHVSEDDLGQPFPMLVHDARWEGVRAELDGGRTVYLDAVSAPTPGARSSVTDWVVAPWQDERGNWCGALVHAPGVSRSLPARAIGRQQTSVRSLFDQSPIGLNLCRIDGLWLESNTAFLDMLGYSAEEADGGLTYWELTPREYEDAERAQLESLKTTGRYGPYEKEFIRKDGSRIPVRLNGFMIEHDGQRLIWSLIEDISAQRQLEAQLQQQRFVAEHASRLASIGEIAAGVAHELNNPLQIIEAAAYELQDAFSRGEPPPTDVADDIRRATSRASKIVQGLRTFAREDVPEAHPLRVDDLIDEALGLTRSRILSHGVALDVDVNTERCVRCTPLEMTQVLVNLVSNAFDAVVEDRGAIHLTARDNGPDHVVIRVSDSGAGVREDLRERIFEPFFSTKPVGVGMGLGLSICKRVVGALGGTITCERGQQSAFVVRVPAEGCQ